MGSRAVQVNFVGKDESDEKKEKEKKSVSGFSSVVSDGGLCDLGWCSRNGMVFAESGKKETDAGDGNNRRCKT